MKKVLLAMLGVGIAMSAMADGKAEKKSEEEINELESKIDKLIEYSIEKYKNEDINPLHLLCNKITRLSREIYRKDQNDILDDLDFPLDDKDYKKKLSEIINRK